METKETHKWTPDETRKLIRFRAENEQRFLRSKSAARSLWETLIKELGLEGKLNPQQASKKWENLKKKYKELKTPRTGSGTDAGEVTAATWQYYEEMNEVLGARPSIDPPVVVASFGESGDPITLLMEIVEPTTSDTSDSSFVSAASVTPTPPTPPVKKRKRSVFDFLEAEAAKEQKRHEESEAKTERFLALFEKLIDKL